jgi:hypothetical protein|tara:strand:- start:2596 stop:3762 length:1167 start_codon:yes stop_codon:yes gene_type:complete
MLSYLLIKIDRVSTPTIAFQYYFTDQLKADKEISKLLLSPGVLVNKNKTKFEVQILNFVSSNFSRTDSIAMEKDFQIIIDLASPSILSFYVVNDDVGLDPAKLTKDNNIRSHLNPSRTFSFKRESLKSFRKLLQNEITFLHKRSQELYSAIKNIRPLLSPFVISPYLYSSGLAKKVRYYNETCHMKSIQYDPTDIYSSFIFNSSYKEYEKNKTLFSIESGWTDPQIKGSRAFINEVLKRCSYFEIESKDKLERSNKLTKILGFRVSEFKLFFKPSETKYLTKFLLVNSGGKNPLADIVRKNTKFGEIISFYIDYIKKNDRFLVITSGFIDLVGKCDNFIDELNEQYPVKSLNLSLNNDYKFPIGKETINVRLTQSDIPSNCRITLESL